MKASMKIQRGNKEPLIKGETIQFYRSHFGFSLLIWSRNHTHHFEGRKQKPNFKFTIFTFPPSWLITVFVTRVTRQVSPVEQELFTPARAHAFTPGFSGVRVTRYYPLICMFCRSLFVPFVLFHLTIVLSVLLRFTDSVYLLGIFKSSYTHHVGRVKTKTQISSSTHLQLLNNVIIIKTKVLLSQMVAILLKIFGCLAPKDYKKIDFPIFWQGRT
jgi:hypothetical protein